MWTALVVTLVLGAPPAKDAPSEKGEDRELKVLGRSVWPVRNKQPAQLVIRSAEELARSHGIEGQDAKDPRFQADVTADAAQLLKVKTIDWKKQMLVVVAAGTKPTGGYTIEILTLPVKDKTLTVHWKLNSPKPDSPVRKAPTYPGQMVLIERFTGEVKFDPPLRDK
jgi:hypothetical protein